MVSLLAALSSKH